MRILPFGPTRVADHMRALPPESVPMHRGHFTRYDVGVCLAVWLPRHLLTYRRPLLLCPTSPTQSPAPLLSHATAAAFLPSASSLGGSWTPGQCLTALLLSASTCRFLLVMRPSGSLHLGRPATPPFDPVPHRCVAAHCCWHHFCCIP